MLSDWKSRLQRAAAAARVAVRGLLPHTFSLAAWLRLLRLPNLLTVPGDMLAGFLLAPAADGADWVQLVLLAFPAGLFFYTAGILLNDLFGYAEDLRERPWRPLPAGHISRENAVATALVLAWVAAFAAAFFDALPVALPLILCIILYNIGLKRVPWLGPLLMGACRAGNFLLGAAAAGDGLVLAPGPVIGAVVLAAYIATVTHLARKEAIPDATITPQIIGRLLRMLIPLQALLSILAIHRFPANLLGLALLPLLPLHRRLSARFPPS